METKVLNKSLQRANKEKNDEFYTQLTDIEKELNHYKEHFKDKQCYIFLCNTLSQYEFDNFPDIDIWVNTACPRIEGKNIINASDLPKEHE